MNSWIEDLRRWTPECARAQTQSGLGVDRRFVLGKDDQGRPGLIEPWIHAGGDLQPAVQRKANMHAVAHLVCGERALDLLNDLVARWKIDNRQGAGRALEPIEMLVQLEDAPAIKPESFPDGVAALHCRIERTNSCLVAMQQSAVDIHDQVAVLLVKLLQHVFFLSSRMNVRDLPFTIQITQIT